MVMKPLRKLLVLPLAFLCTGCWQVVVVKKGIELYMELKEEIHYEYEGEILRAVIRCDGFSHICHCTYYHDNGLVHMDGPVMADTWHGRVMVYDTTGEKLASIVYELDQRHGTSMWFHTNGKVEVECKYERDKLHGGYVVYDEEGNTLSRTYYKHDLLHGAHYEFENWRVVFEAWYENDSLLYFTRFDQDGEIVENQGPENWRQILETQEW
ncbi:MAG: hypothetical protein EA392_06250 [Cryomorphaceae bacterium]|nr:MAG: hypothetical protein EA392_06250 [Cryomorphaceae bacterium]